MLTRSKSEKNQMHSNATGPRTARGKTISSRNARKHGLLSQELIVSADDKPTLEHLRRTLRDELQPSSVLLTMLIEDVCVSYWDLMMCIRRKSEYLKQIKGDLPAVNSSSTFSAAPISGETGTFRGGFGFCKNCGRMLDQPDGYPSGGRNHLMELSATLYSTC